MSDQKQRALHQACGNYLKSHETKRIMKALLEKYRSYGTVMGTMVLTKPTPGECRFLQGLLKKQMTPGVTIHVPLKAFESAFIGTIYEGVSLKPLLEVYFDTQIESKREAADKAVTEKLAFSHEVSELLNKMLSDETLARWTSEALFNPKHTAYTLINSLYQEGKLSLSALIGDLAAVILCIQSHEEGIGLPMAAGLSTGNPHALDRGTPLRKLLIHYAAFQKGIAIPGSLHETDELLQQLNLNVDETPRIVLTYGLEAFDDKGDPLGWLAFRYRNEPLNIAAHNLKKVSVITAISQQIYCCENPSTFYRRMRQYPEIAGICISGQPNLVAYQLLDKMSDQHCLYYSGDFDPEGLLIANRLKNRYPRLDLSFYNMSHYHQSISKENISEKRLKQLNQLSDETLVEIAFEMKRLKVAGYEERVPLSVK